MTQESRLVIVIDSRNAERNTRAVADELANLTNKGVQADTQMTAMSSSIKNLVGYMGGLLTINKAIAMADGYTQMAARIRNATQSAEEYTLVQDRLLKTANTTYRQLGEAQEVYLSMAGGMKSLGKSTKDTLDLTDSLSFSFTHNATRVDQAQSAMDSLSKSMAKGKVDGDAWISIVTGADNVIADMAKTTGKTETEIRKLGAEGKVSLEDLIKTLILTRDENEKLANNMENSLADGFTKLSNEVTVYLGKANEATSATGIMAGSLGVLADNLDMVANTGAALGIGYLTSALLTKGAAVKANMLLSAQQQVADRAELVSQTQLTAAEVRRTASLAQFTTMQLADAKATAARMTGIQRLAYVQSTVIPLEAKATQATAAHTVATAADTVAQEINNKARSRGAMLLGLVGGPIGAITLGVTALAAGYMFMSSKGDKANEMLESQSQYASMAADELNRLDGAKRKAAQEDLSKELGILNNKLKASENQFESLVEKVLDSNKTNVEAKRIWSELRAGAIGVDEAYTRLNKTDFVTSDQINQLSESKKKVDDNKVAVKAANQQLDQVKTSGANAKKGFNDAAESAKEAHKEVATLKKELADFNKILEGREFDAQFSQKLLNHGLSEGQTKVMLEVANAAREKGVTATKDMYKEALRIYNLEKNVQDTLDTRNQLLRENTKELEKQQKVLQTSAKVQANAAKYNFGGLESKYNLPNGMLSALHAIETGNSGKTNQVNKQSGATGGFQFLKGTANQYGVKDRTDMAQSAEGAAKYMAYLLKLFKGDLEKAVRAYHAGEGNVQKGKNIGKYNNDYWQKFKGYSAGANGYSAGDISSKDFEKILEDAAKLAEEQAKLRKSLELEVASEVTRIRSKLSDDLQEIDKVGYSSEKGKELKAEYQSRADNDIAIAQYALKTKLDDYEAFKKTESELLKQSFDEKKFYAVRDLELSKDDRAKAVQFLDDQLKQELALIMLAKETRLFQMQQGLMHASAQSDRYWDLERQRIMLSVQDLKERNRQLAIANELHAKEKFDNLNGAAKEWGSINANMTGRGAQLQLQQEDESRAKASEELLLAELDLANTAAQREAIWQAHHERMTAIEMSYQQDSLNMQLTQAQAVTGALSGMFGAMLGESSSAYRALYGAQQAFALAQAGMNVWKSASDAYANEPGTVWQKAGAAALATIESGTFVSMIQAATPQGFATGGKIRGAGTSTSDSIPIMASDEEYMVRAYAAEKLGTPTLDYINKHGELPQNTHRVGAGTMDAINSRKNMGGATVVQPKVVINNYSSEKVETSTNSDGELMVTIGKMLDQKIDSGVDRGIQRNLRQGHPLSNAIKGR